MTVEYMRCAALDAVGERYDRCWDRPAGLAVCRDQRNAQDDVAEACLSLRKSLQASINDQARPVLPPQADTKWSPQ